MQGIYIFAPSGELLARRNSNNPDLIAGIIDQALVKWENLPDDRRTLADVSEVTPEFRWTDSYPVGGLVLRRTARDLPETAGAAGERAKRFNRDSVWFTAAEARLWLPEDLEIGATRELPAVIVNRLSQFVLVDNTRGQTIPYHESEVAGSSLTVQIDAIDNNLVDIRITGATSAVAQGPWLLGENYWKPNREHPHSIATSMYGTATFDLARKVFVIFDVLALGERHGRTVMNGRRADDESGRIGFVLELAPSEWRVAPTFINMYDADWVKQPPVATSAGARGGAAEGVGER